MSGEKENNMANIDINELAQRALNGEVVRMKIGNVKLTIRDDTLANYEVDLAGIDLDDLNPDELDDLRDRLEKWYDRLDAEEPEDEESAEHDEWEELRSDIEDAMDDIDDLLEE